MALAGSVFGDDPPGHHLELDPDDLGRVDRHGDRAQARGVGERSHEHRPRVAVADPVADLGPQRAVQDPDRPSDLHLVDRPDGGVGLPDLEEARDLDAHRRHELDVLPVELERGQLLLIGRVGIDDHADKWTIAQYEGEKSEPAREWE